MAEAEFDALIASMRKVDKSKLSITQRLQLASAAQGLVLEMERPWDTILRMCWSEPSIFATLRTLVDLQLFEKWVDVSPEVQDANQLGELVGCDPGLMERLVRNLASHKLLTNPGPHLYGLTEFTRSLADFDQSSAFPFFYDINLTTLTSLPEWLAKEGYKDPVDKSPANCAFTMNKKFDGTLFDYFAQNPESNERMGRAMKGVAGSMIPWVDQYPTEDLVTDEEGVVVVDVGGSTGHDLNAFQRKHSLASGRAVLQDLPEVVAKAEVEVGITVMGHNFFTPQPVKGAKIYYLHSVLHDWPDDKALEILSNLTPAMVKGRSKILLHEHVLWPQGNTAMSTYSDVLMLGVCNGCERTIEGWKKVIEPAGLMIKEVYTSPSSPHSILELELA